MIKVIGVRFRTAGKIYFFDPVDFDIHKGDHVIVETARGIEFGTVMSGIREVTDDEVVQPLKPVLRIATERDVKQEADNKKREKEAYRICLEKIREHELDMKLIDAEYTFDNNKVLFYFTADGRIDFRDLVKDLASIFKTRIELRQIGVRDETKIMGGIGMCGRPLCCHAHLSDFVAVSIKMAKEQNLSLNPTKISGVCGRLMCCLKHEEETYEELNRSLPHIGDRVTCPNGIQGEVSSVNVLRQQVKVVVENGDSKEIREYKAEDLRFVKKGHRQAKENISAEELRALELLEKQDELDSKESEEGSERQSRKERKERGNRKERYRKDRDRTDKSVPTESDVIPEDLTAEMTSGDREQSPHRENTEDKKERSDRKRRSNKNHNKGGQRTDKNPSVAEEQGIISAEAEKADGADTSEHREDGERKGRNHYKKHYYRNRRRNRPEGAKEQHES